MTTIINYDMGNVGSIQNMCKKVGFTVPISSKKNEIAEASALILPGVGAFDHGMMNLKKSGLDEMIKKLILEQKIPILGICLGMQLLTEKSEEGTLPGLGLVKGKTVRFQFDDAKLKIPHMGWNTVRAKKNHFLFNNNQNARFYFVHSYYVVCDGQEDVLTETEYGIPFCSSLQHENIIGVQFHPEKSHTYGMKLLKNFLEHVNNNTS